MNTSTIHVDSTCNMIALLQLSRLEQKYHTCIYTAVSMILWQYTPDQRCEATTQCLIIFFCFFQCSSKWNCTNARLRTFCGDDGHTYSSRCQMRQKECITGRDIRIRHTGECRNDMSKFASHAHFCIQYNCMKVFVYMQCLRNESVRKLETL